MQKIWIIEFFFENRPNTHTHNKTPLIYINWDSMPSGYAVNLDNWILL
jgi:hypothetical protein